MTDDSDLLSALPRTRPHRRSSRRPERGRGVSAKPAAAQANAAVPNAKPTAPQATAAAPRTKAAVTKAKSAAPQPKPRATKDSPDAPKRLAEPYNRPLASSGSRLRQPAQPVGTPSARASGRSVAPDRQNVIGTAVQAAGELAEIGLSLSTRAVRNALGRLPRP